MKRITLFLVLIALLLLVGSAMAMSSANYKLTWFTPLTGNSGRSMSSANYAANFTIGQTVDGTAVNTTYQSCLGYWCGIPMEYKLLLPMILKNI